MRRLISCAASILVVSSQAITFSQGRLPPTSATFISKAEIEGVLKYKGSEGAGTDRQIKVVDMGKYNVGVGVLHREPTTPGAAPSGIAHSQVAEIYYVISGTGTFISGVKVVNRRDQAPDAEVVRLAVGPSFNGTFEGGETRVISAGDVVIIPPGVLHGFTDIKEQITYLSVRTDADHVLPAGYMHPTLRK
jgi:mannose-6-phosphate isomerase-like protein (cupin superfamily)